MANLFEGADAVPRTKSCPLCGEQILEMAIKCKHCGEMLGTPAELGALGNIGAVYAEYQTLKTMRKRYNLISFACGLPALLLLIGQVGMSSAMEEGRGPPDGVTLIVLTTMFLSGIILWACAFIFAAKYKGRSGLWGLAVFLGCFGLLVIAVLKDLNNERLIELKAMLKVMGREV